MMSRRIALIAVVVLAWATPAASAHERFSVRTQPKVVSWAGGTFVLTVKGPHIRHAQCETLYAPGPEERFVPCRHHSLRVVEPNAFYTRQTWHGQLVIRQGRHTTRLHFSLSQQAKPAPAPAPKPYNSQPPNNSQSRFLFYNNAELGDCTLAAVANWEQIALGTPPDEPDILAVFAALGNHGLHPEEVWHYWHIQGINGVLLYYVDILPYDRASYETSTERYTALIAELNLNGNSYFGTEQRAPETNGKHWVATDGSTPSGPLVVTWGEVRQMTWEQWEDDIENLWIPVT